MSGYRFGPFTLEERLQRLVRDGEIVPLKPKAYDLLTVLLSNRDRVLAKDELLDWLWPRQVVSEANLAQTVYELRQALGDSARDGGWIETVPRRGYRFAGDVTAPADGGARAVPRSLAVLPFRVLVAVDAGAELGVCLADSVIHSLSRTGRLVVRPLSAVLQNVVLEQDALAAGRALEVDAVLEGTVQHVGETLRVTARLLRVASGEDLWSERFETAADDLFAVQDRIAVRVADSVSLQLSSDERARMAEAAPTRQDVHALTMKARYCWQQWEPAALRQALEYLDAAIVLEPGHAPSHAWRGATWLTLGILEAVTPHEASAAARRAAERSIALDPDLSDGHEMLGALELFFGWDLVAAARSLDRAIELDPNSSNARHLRALTLAVGGHDQSALAEMHRALHADPSSLIANADVGMIHYWGRRFDEARTWLESTLEQDPDFSHARLGLAYVRLALGDGAGALREIDRVATDSGRDVSGESAYLRGRAGDPAAARTAAEALAEGWRDGTRDPRQLMMAWLGADERDRALDWLERAFEHGSRGLILLDVDPALDPLRGAERFERIRQRVIGA